MIAISVILLIIGIILFFVSAILIADDAHGGAVISFFFCALFLICGCSLWSKYYTKNTSDVVDKSINIVEKPQYIEYQTTHVQLDTVITLHNGKPDTTYVVRCLNN